MSELIKQDDFFDGLDFEKIVLDFGIIKKVCYKGKDGGYYSVDHFKGYYVIEFAKDYEDAVNNAFEDADTFDDSMPKDEIIRKVIETLISYTNE